MRDPRRALAETLSQIDTLLGEGVSREDALCVPELSAESGVPQDVVKALLDGQEAPPEDITDRIISRIVHLRETRRRPDGSQHSYEEIALSFGASRASLKTLVSRQRKAAAAELDAGPRGRASGPLASTTAGVEKFFFGEPSGWLSAEPESALNDALQGVVAKLRAAARGEPYIAPRESAMRTAAALPDDKWELVQGLIEALEKQVRRERGFD
ncbi:hypothetical protein [Streptomyces sp. NBC_01462]|uniref:hypothetical protein n=1 Tax=Streptomyces sp. NBC_01462 TaxID=2903876 RepID=UPI002E358B94|nr:hypothetical protein [Streptomyces sp. NBC_01462]